MHMSQPAVTQAVAGLESHFGAELLTRHTRGVSPTPAGEVCVVRIERALTQLRDALTETRTTEGQRVDFTRLVRSRQLGALSSVVELGNFSAAARARRTSQSSVHRSARELERVLGFALFEKTSFGVTPTRDALRLASDGRWRTG